MEAGDLELRRTTYALIVELGRVPDAGEVAQRTRSTPEHVREGWRRLHDAHALVLDASGREIRMANPFSGVPTPYRVRVAGRSWYANCAWDAFGVCAALQADGRVEATCPDCGDPLTVDVMDAEPSDRSLLFHCLVPARDWWADIGFT